MKKKVTIILIILLICGGFYFFAKKGKTKVNTTSNIKTAKIQFGNFAVYVNSTGVIEPKFTVEIKSKANGEIIKLPYEEGDYVKKGDLLIELDPSDENRNLAKAEADLKKAESDLLISKSNLKIEKNDYIVAVDTVKSNLKTAEVNFEDAQKKYERAKKLFKEKLISSEEFENEKKVYDLAKSKYDLAVAEKKNLNSKKEKIIIYENNVKISEVSVLKAKISLQEAQERKNETKIYSPVDGVVLTRNVSSGQIISSATSNVSGGSLLYTIADISKLFVIADVDESDIGKVKKNQPVKLTVDTFRDLNFTGRVDRIKPQGVEESNVTIFNVKIAIEQVNGDKLLPGMTANIEIEIQRHDNTFFVPFAAVKSKGKRNFIVLVKENNKYEKIRVKTGITDGENIEIFSDEIKENDSILLSDLSNIESGKNGRKRDNAREFGRGMRRISR